jgi:hypothetical protein
MLSFFVLIYVKCDYALCIDAELLYADCHSAKCHKLKCHDAITNAVLTFGSSLKVSLY